jgi:CubicO group peptidase (beta-lactamase class C family)
VRGLLIITVMTTVGACAKKPAEVANPVADSLAAVAQRFAADSKVPGLAAGVWHGGAVVYRGGFGTAGGKTAGRQIGPETLFHMASVTKPFVATAIMQLVEAGKVSLDSTVVRYLPYFAMKDPRARAITVRQVLSHTAGIGDVTDYQWDKPEYDPGALERYVRGLKDSTSIAAPGEKWQYSNIGFEVLADLIAKVSGLEFESYVQQRILTPLGMRKSTLLMTDIDSSLMAYGHSPDSAGVYQATAAYPYNRRHAASSTLHSNVDDMLRWGAANLGRGTLDGVRILADSSYDQLWKVQRDMTAELTERATRAGIKVPYDRMGVGLSWFLPSRDGRQLVSHGGGDTGFRTDILLSPTEQVAIVVMANGDRVNVQDLSMALLEVVRQNPPAKSP